jgi:predicted metalloendopeptidase
MQGIVDKRPSIEGNNNSPIDMAVRPMDDVYMANARWLEFHHIPGWTKVDIRTVNSVFMSRRIDMVG